MKNGKYPLVAVVVSAYDSGSPTTCKLSDYCKLGGMNLGTVPLTRKRVRCLRRVARTELRI
jgi:hypothetical protein